MHATRDTLPLVRELRPDVVVADILTLAPALAAELEGVPCATLIPHVYPDSEPRLPDLLARRAPAAHGRSGARCGAARQRPVAARPGARPPRAERTRARGSACRRSPTSTAASAASSRSSATFPQLEYPRAWPRARARRRPADVGAAGAPRSSCPPGDDPLVLVAPSTAQDPEHRLLRAALRGLADAPGAGARDLEPPPALAAAAGARQRAARRVGLLLAHDAPLRRRSSATPATARSCARSRSGCAVVACPARRRHERERRAPGLGRRGRARAAPLRRAAPAAPGGRAGSERAVDREPRARAGAWSALTTRRTPRRHWSSGWRIADEARGGWRLAAQTRRLQHARTKLRGWDSNPQPLG